jgi:hypothetical protein
MQDPTKLYQFLKKNNLTGSKTEEEFTSWFQSSRDNGSKIYDFLEKKELQGSKSKEDFLNHFYQEPETFETSEDIPTETTPTEEPINVPTGEPIDPSSVDQIGSSQLEFQTTDEAGTIEPFELTGDSPGDFIANAINRGIAMGKTANEVNAFIEDGDLDPVQIAEYQKQIAESGGSEVYKKFMNSQGLGDVWDVLTESPEAFPSIVAELSLESLAALAAHGWNRAAVGAAEGAAIGTVVPGAGTVAGMGLGAAGGLGVASYNLEYSGKIIDSLNEMGVDLTDPEQIAEVFTNEEKMNEFRKKAHRKGVAIATIDMVSMGIAGKFSKPGVKIAEKALREGAEFATQAGMGMAGEFVGQLAAGEDINAVSIVAEGLGEFGGSAPEMLHATVASKKRRGQDTREEMKKLAATEDGKQFEQQLTRMQEIGMINTSQADELRTQFIEEKDLLNSIPEDKRDEETIELVREKRQNEKAIEELEKSKEDLDSAYHAEIDEEIGILEANIQSLNNLLTNERKETTEQVTETTGDREAETAQRGETGTQTADQTELHSDRIRRLKEKYPGKTNSEIVRDLLNRLEDDPENVVLLDELKTAEFEQDLTTQQVTDEGRTDQTTEQAEETTAGPETDRGSQKEPERVAFKGIPEEGQIFYYEGLKYRAVNVKGNKWDGVNPDNPQDRVKGVVKGETGVEIPKVVETKEDVKNELENTYGVKEEIAEQAAENSEDVQGKQLTPDKAAKKVKEVVPPEPPKLEPLSPEDGPKKRISKRVPRLEQTPWVQTWIKRQAKDIGEYTVVDFVELDKVTEQMIESEKETPARDLFIEIVDRLMELQGLDVDGDTKRRMIPLYSIMLEKLFKRENDAGTLIAKEIAQYIINQKGAFATALASGRAKDNSAALVGLIPDLMISLEKDRQQMRNKKIGDKTIEQHAKDLQIDHTEEKIRKVIERVEKKLSDKKKRRTRSAKRKDKGQNLIDEGIKDLKDIITGKGGQASAGVPLNLLLEATGKIALGLAYKVGGTLQDVKDATLDILRQQGVQNPEAIWDQVPDLDLEVEAVLNKNVEKVILDHYIKQDDRRSLSAKLEETGLSKQEAMDYERAMEKNWRDLYKDEIREELERRFQQTVGMAENKLKRLEADLKQKGLTDLERNMIEQEIQETHEFLHESRKKKHKSVLDKMVDDLALGALSEGDIRERFLDRYGFPSMTADVARRLITISERIRNAKDGRERSKAYNDFLYEVDKMKNRNLAVRVMQYTQASIFPIILSGLTTLSTALNGSVIAMMSDVIPSLMTMLTKKPALAAKAIRDTFTMDNWKAALNTAVYTMKTGGDAIKFSDFDTATNQLIDRLVNTPITEISGDNAVQTFAKAMYKLLLTIPAVMTRFLGAIDTFLKVGLQDFFGTQEAFMDLVKNGLDPSSADFMIQLEERLGTDVKQIAKDKVAEEVSARKDYNTSQTREKLDVSKGWQAYRFKELMMEMADQFVRQKAAEAAEKALLMNQPKAIQKITSGKSIKGDDTFLGALGKLLGTLAFPIVRVPYNLIMQGVTYTPPAAVRNMIVGPDRELGGRTRNIASMMGLGSVIPGGNDLKWQQRMLKGAIGTATFLGLLASMFDMDEDEEGRTIIKKKGDDWTFRITGSGSPSYARTKMVDEHYRPNALQWKTPNGVRYIRYTDYPGGAMILPIGDMWDQLSFNDEVDHLYLDGGTMLQWGLVSPMSFFYQQSYSQSIEDAMQLFNLIGSKDPDQDPETQKEDNLEKWERFLAKKGQAVIPIAANVYKQSWKIKKQLYDESIKDIERDDWGAVNFVKPFVKGLPFVENLISGEAYDILGAPIEEDVEVPYLTAFPSLIDHVDNWVNERSELSPGHKLLLSDPAIKPPARKYTVRGELAERLTDQEQLQLKEDVCVEFGMLMNEYADGGIKIGDDKMYPTGDVQEINEDIKKLWQVAIRKAKKYYE